MIVSLSLCHHLSFQFTSLLTLCPLVLPPVFWKSVCYACLHFYASSFPLRQTILTKKRPASLHSSSSSSLPSPSPLSLTSTSKKSNLFFDMDPLVAKISPDSFQSTLLASNSTDTRAAQHILECGHCHAQAGWSFKPVDKPQTAPPTNKLDASFKSGLEASNAQKRQKTAATQSPSTGKSTAVAPRAHASAPSTGPASFSRVSDPKKPPKLSDFLKSLK